MSKCSFRDNSAEWGGGLANFGQANPSLTDCVFTGNLASMSGGGVYNGNSDPELVNCILHGDYGIDSGGGMCNHVSAPSLVNCTVTYNGADTVAGGIHNCYGRSPTLSNCILCGNEVGGIMDEPAQMTGKSPVVNYTCIQGWTGGLGGEGNMGDDPLFMVKGFGSDGLPGTADDDLHLQSGSPGINAGSYDATGLPAQDLDGNPRVQQCRVDMGASESADPPAAFDDCNTNGVDDDCDLFVGTSPDCNGNHEPDECDIAGGASLDCNATTVPDDCETIGNGDFDADGEVGLADYAVLFDCLAGPTATPDPPLPPECADLCLTVFDSDEDGDVDLEDVAWFQEAFGG